MSQKPISAQTLVQAFEAFAPKAYAVEGDKNGLMIGTLNQTITNVMVTLDVLESTIDEAIEKDVDFILAHHPLLFRPLKQINLVTAMGRIIKKALLHNITIYAAHTNLDVAGGGVNDMLAEKLAIVEPRVLAPTFEEKMVKLAVFVPLDHAEAIRTALGDAGAGFIGEYSHCSFSAEGQGSFRPLATANPFIGEGGKQEYVKEVKIETVIPSRKRKEIIAACLAAHPYEEPAYDVYPLEEPKQQLGLGRIGQVEQRQTLRVYAQPAKPPLGVELARVVGDLDKTIQTAAVLGGDGNKYVFPALHSGADVLVTGDLYYHVAQDARMEGMAIIDAGHHIESIMKEGVANELKTRLNSHGYALNVFPSEASTDPFQFL